MSLRMLIQCHCAVSLCYLWYTLTPYRTMSFHPGWLIWGSMFDDNRGKIKEPIPFFLGGYVPRKLQDASTPINISVLPLIIMLC
ncbi:hypothetical protein HD806DRAFT_101721 [Xylariaceae sp. AK1471]|nr:hypothetical protein HD806DRAFT_101721 [Xylariaceae sp. AK1471]